MSSPYEPSSRCETGDDSATRENFQFWSFSDATGNPTSFSAYQLREAIEGAVHTRNPHSKNPALQQFVLIGHSQAGLLAKWVAIDSGSRLWATLSDKPPEVLQLSEETGILTCLGTCVETAPSPLATTRPSARGMSPTRFRTRQSLR